MPVTVAEAKVLLNEVVNEGWGQKARPMLGSQIKARLLQKLPTFNEKDLGYKNFASFIRDCEGIAFRFRGDTDFAVVPAQFEKVLEEKAPSAELRQRIRSDFWQAFVAFAVPNQIRGYIRELDKVFRGPADNIPKDALLIAPIGKEEQLQWRREFVESLGPDSPLSRILPTLTIEGGFKALSDSLEAHPDLRRRWHTVLANHVVGVIRAWATPHGIPDQVWLVSEVSRPITPDTTRKRVYELLDTLPIEDLLDVRLPIRSLLNLPPRKPPVD